VNHDGIFSTSNLYYTTEELFFPEFEFGGGARSVAPQFVRFGLYFPVRRLFLSRNIEGATDAGSPPRRRGRAPLLSRGRPRPGGVRVADADLGCVWA
jgi:hypothetical protein